MEKLVLKKEMLDRIQNDPDLFAKMAKHLNVRPVTLPRILYINHKRLTEATTLKFISKLLKVDEKDLLKTVREHNNNTQEPQLQVTH